MAKKVKTNTKSTTHKMVWIIAFIILGVIVIGSIFSLSTKKAEAVNATSGYSTLPGWSAGYRYYFDMDEDQKSHIRLFGKYKQSDGDTFSIGWDRQTGKDLNQFNTNIDDDGVIFFEQEFKF